MSDTDRHVDQTAIVPTPSRAQGQPDEPMDEEEKVLAGRPDVNLPALLTRDVAGG